VVSAAHFRQRRRAHSLPLAECRVGLLVRHVEDSDPHNPDVVYNKGHLLQQHTFFLGDVNFYYEVRGVKYYRRSALLRTCTAARPHSAPRRAGLATALLCTPIAVHAVLCRSNRIAAGCCVHGGYCGARSTPGRSSCRSEAGQ
jgi:hypothetical protein